MAAASRAVEALFHVVSKEDPAFAGKRGVFLRAQAHPAVGDFDLCCVQTFRPLYDGLAAAGIDAATELPAAADYAFFAATRSREENRAALTALHALLPEGGVIVACQQKDLGADALQKDMAEIFTAVRAESKFHSRAIFAVKDDAHGADVCRAWTALGAPAQVEDTGMQARAGLFSSKSPDRGSVLLQSALPQELAGVAADLGAGWGYLSAALLRAPAIVRVDLYEAEKQALDMAAENLAAAGARAAYHWADLETSLLKASYDVIVANPPVHRMDVQDNALGQRIVGRGLRALKPGGRMYVVANVHLPYEREAGQGYAVQTLAKGDGYKVLEFTRI